MSEAAPALRLYVANLFGAATDHDRFAWAPFREGVEIARLYGDGARGPSAALLRYAPGARVPAHVHHGMEHIIVLAGAQVDADGTYGPGGMLVHGPGTSHAVVSEQGCVALAIWERPVEIRFSLTDPWSRRLFIALCRRYGLRPFRYPRMHRQSLVVKVPQGFLDQVLWPEFAEINAALGEYLADITDKVIRALNTAR